MERGGESRGVGRRRRGERVGERLESTRHVLRLPVLIICYSVYLYMASVF